MKKINILMLIAFCCGKSFSQIKPKNLKEMLDGKWLYDSTLVGDIKIKSMGVVKKDYALFLHDTLTITEDGEKQIGKWQLVNNNIIKFESLKSSESLEFLITSAGTNILILSDNKKNAINKEVKICFSR